VLLTLIDACSGYDSSIDSQFIFPDRTTRFNLSTISETSFTYQTLQNAGVSFIWLDNEVTNVTFYSDDLADNATFYPPPEWYLSKNDAQGYGKQAEPLANQPPRTLTPGLNFHGTELYYYNDPTLNASWWAWKTSFPSSNLPHYHVSWYGTNDSNFECLAEQGKYQ